MIISHFSRILISIVALLATIQITINGQTTIELSNLPLLSIETIEGQDPTATKVYPPEGAAGESIISNYVPGRLVITQKGKGVYDSGDYVKGESGIRIKIRGDALKTDCGEAVTQSMELHRNVYEDECMNTLDEQIEEALSHLKARMKSLETLTAELSKETSIDGVASMGNKMVKRVNIYGMDYTNVNEKELPQNIYIEQYADGTVKKIYR